jgi:hypothetical protein
MLTRSKSGTSTAASTGRQLKQAAARCRKVGKTGKKAKTMVRKVVREAPKKPEVSGKESESSCCASPTDSELEWDWDRFDEMNECSSSSESSPKEGTVSRESPPLHRYPTDLESEDSNNSENSSPKGTSLRKPTYKDITGESSDDESLSSAKATFLRKHPENSSPKAAPLKKYTEEDVFGSSSDEESMLPEELFPVGGNMYLYKDAYPETRLNVQFARYNLCVSASYNDYGVLKYPSGAVLPIGAHQIELLPLKISMLESKDEKEKHPHRQIITRLSEGNHTTVRKLSMNIQLKSDDDMVGKLNAVMHTNVHRYELVDAQLYPHTDCINTCSVRSFVRIHYEAYVTESKHGRQPGCDKASEWVWTCLFLAEILDTYGLDLHVMLKTVIPYYESRPNDRMYAEPLRAAFVCMVEHVVDEEEMYHLVNLRNALALTV